MPKIVSVPIILLGVTSIIFSISIIYIALTTEYRLLRPCLFNTDTILDWNALLQRLKKPKNRAGKRVRFFLDEKCREIVDNWIPHTEMAEPSKAAIIDRLNQILKDYYFYDPDDFGGLEISRDGEILLEKGPKNLNSNEIQKFNKLVFESIYTKEIKKNTAKNCTEVFAELLNNKLLAKSFFIVSIAVGVVSFLLYVEFVWGLYKLFSLFNSFEPIKYTAFDYLKSFAFNIISYFFKFCLIAMGIFGLTNTKEFIAFLQKETFKKLAFMPIILLAEGVMIIMMTRYLPIEIPQF